MEHDSVVVLDEGNVLANRNVFYFVELLATVNDQNFDSETKKNKQRNENACINDEC